MEEGVDTAEMCPIFVWTTVDPILMLEGAKSIWLLNQRLIYVSGGGDHGPNGSLLRTEEGVMLLPHPV